MKILIVSQYFYPEQFRINDVCSALVKRGHDVTVLTGLPNYPSGEIYQGYEDKGNTEEIIFGARVVRCNLRPRHRGTNNLIRNYLSFVNQSKKIIKRLDKDYEIIYVYGVSPVTQAIPAIKYKKKVNKKAKILYYCCDLWPEAVRGEQNGHRQLSKHNPVYLIAKSITKKIYKKVDFIINKCDEFAQYNEKVCKVNTNKQTTIFEHAEDFYLNVPEDPVDNGIVDFFFLGNIGKAQNCDQIIEAFSKLSSSNKTALHFVGDGSEAERLKVFVKNKKIEQHIHFHGKCTISEINNYYAVADVCVLALSNRTATGFTIPAKLASYMAAARPIVASINGSSSQIINEANCGYTANADDVDGLANAMQKCVDYPNNLIQMGINGRKFFNEHFTIDLFIDNLLNTIRRVVNNESCFN